MMSENWEEIIWRALRGECSAEELDRLQDWRNEFFGNERVYEEMEEFAEMGTFLKGVDSLHKDQALENVLKRTRRGGGYSFPVVALRRRYLVSIVVGRDIGLPF